MASSPRPAQNKLMSRGVMPWLAVTALLLTLTVGGYVFFQNQADSQSSNVTDTTSPSTPSTEDPIVKSPSEELVNDYSIVLEDWSIKFTTPSDLKDTKVKYYQYRDGDNNVTYGFTTERVQALGGRCAEQPYGGIYHLVRSKEKPDFTPEGAFINQMPINGYYYSYYSGLSGCSSLDKNGQFISQPSQVELDDRKRLQELLSSLTLSEET